MSDRYEDDQRSGYRGGGYQRDDRRQDYGQKDDYAGGYSSNQSQGEASSYYNSNDDFRSSGRRQEGGYENSGRREDRYDSNSGRDDFESTGRYDEERRHESGGRDERFGRQDQGGYGNDYTSGMTGSYPNTDNDDFSAAGRHASQHAGNSGDSNIFSNVLSLLSQRKNDIGNEDIDEQEAIASHQQYFGDNGPSPSSSTPSSMGTAAALQALKKFTSGESSSQSAGGNSQNQFIGLAMAEASKLFDHQASQGNLQSGASKESAVAQAAQMALKMYLKGQAGSSGGGGGIGPGGLLSIAGKFL